MQSTYVHNFRSVFKGKKTGENFNTQIMKKKCSITIVETGINTMTGGRLKKIKKYINDKNFMFTYGDGISNIDLKKLLIFHKKNKKLITISAVRPPARFGEIILNKNLVTSFKEKPQVTDGWINGGFFVANKKFLDFIRGDKEILEKKPLELACQKKQLIEVHFAKCSLKEKPKRQ